MIKEFTLKTDSEGMYDITRVFQECVAESGVEEGVAYIFCPHTTAGITISENTDQAMISDMLLGLARAFPNYEDYKHNENNSFAHIKASIIGCEVHVPITGSWPVLGPWQALYFCEFDGPRARRYYIKILEG